MPCQILSIPPSVGARQRLSSHARLVSWSILLQLPSPPDHGERTAEPFLFLRAIAIVWGSGSRDLWETDRVPVPGTAAKFENERQALYNCRDETCVRRRVQPSPEASPVENIRSRCSDCCVGRSRDLHEPGRIPQPSSFGGSGRDRFRSRSYAAP